MRRFLSVLALLILGLVPAATAGPGAPLGYIVVLESGVSTSAVATDHAQELGLDVGYRLSQRPSRLLGSRASRRGRRAESRSACRLRRARLDHARRHDPDRRDVGNRPDRPARTSAQRHLHLYGDRRRRDRVRDRHRHPQDALASSAAALSTATDTTTPIPITSDDCHGHGTHVAGTVGGATYGVAQERPPRRRARSHLRRHRFHLGSDRRRRLGDRQPPGRPARGREHEPRRWQVRCTRAGGRELDRRRCHLRSGRRQRDRGRVHRFALRPWCGDHGRRDHEHATRGRATATSARAWTSSRPARTSLRRPISRTPARRR